MTFNLAEQPLNLTEFSNWMIFNLTEHSTGKLLASQLDDLT